MDESVIERIFATGVQVGVINLAAELGLIDENMSAEQAYKKYGERLVKEWRSKRWIIGYPTGNKVRAKYCFKRSELETASRMMAFGNIIPDTRINQIISYNESISRKPDKPSQKTKKY